MFTTPPLHLKGIGKLLLLAALLLALLVVGSVALAVSLHLPGKHLGAVSSLGLNAANAKSGQSAAVTNYDTRPCASTPSADTCNGQYPVTPQGVAPQVGVQNGSGACINGATKMLESQNVSDGNGNSIGILQLTWSSTCKSYYSTVSLVSATVPSVKSVTITVQSESYGWYQKVSQLPPWVLLIERTGPLQGTDLSSTPVLYTPLLYSPTDPVSTYIDLELTDGSTYGTSTGSYKAGVFQYVAVA